MRVGELIEILKDQPPEAEVELAIVAPVGDEKEDITVLEIPFANALRMISSGEIQDAKTVILLQYAQIHGLMEGSQKA